MKNRKGKFKKVLIVEKSNGDSTEVSFQSENWQAADDQQIRSSFDEMKKEAPLGVVRALDRLRSHFE